MQNNSTKQFFSAGIADWYKKNKRDLPWRKTKDPYKIWLSEIILQQTRVEQGLPYYENFVKEFNTVYELAKASEQKVLKLWQGLGYYSRARNLHFTAKKINKEYKGVFPDKFDDILKLKGVGSYTASAIASFAFDQSYAVVDGNVFRILSRYFGISTPVDSSAGKKEFELLAGELIRYNPPALHNQAVMEMGAMVCKPVAPDCENCPLSSCCYAYKMNSIESFPVKGKKVRVKKIYFNYVVMLHQNKLYFNKRNNNGIWKNLYDFPLIESAKKISVENVLKHFFDNFSVQYSDVAIKEVSGYYRHQLSHRSIYAKFILLKLNKPYNNKKLKSFTNKEYARIPLPRLIDKYCSELVKKGYY